VQYFSRADPSLNVIADVVDDVDAQSSFDAALLDSTLGWISSSSDLVRLFEALSAAAASPSSTASPLLTPSSVRSMLGRPSYDRKLPGTAADTQTKVWYGLGLVVDDGGRTFWHSGTLDGATSVVARDDDVGLSWAALINCRLTPNNDLWDFMRYAVRQVFAVQLPTTPLPRQPTSSYLSSPSSPSSSSSSAAAAALADAAFSWQQQQDSSVSDQNEAFITERKIHSKEVDDNNEVSAVRYLVDSVSVDGQTAVKLMVASYRVSEIVSEVAAAGYRVTWLDAVNYRGRIFFNVIWTRNDDQLRYRRLSFKNVWMCDTFADKFLVIANNV